MQYEQKILTRTDFSCVWDDGAYNCTALTEGVN